MDAADTSTPPAGETSAPVQPVGDEIDEAIATFYAVDDTPPDGYRPRVRRDGFRRPRS